MKIWIYINGDQRGPYTLDELAKMDIAPDTPVWYEGLTEWIPASEAPDLKPIIDKSCDTQVNPASNDEEQQDAYVHSTAQMDSSEPVQKANAQTFIGWSIALTICCCGSPFSIAALVGSIITIMRNNAGDEAGAHKASNITEWLVIIAITLGLAFLPFSLLISGLS